MGRGDRGVPLEEDENQDHEHDHEQDREHPVPPLSFSRPADCISRSAYCFRSASVASRGFHRVTTGAANQLAAEGSAPGRRGG